MGNNTIIISWNRDYQEINSASIQFRYHETLAGLSALTAWLRYLLMLGWLSNRMGTSVDDGKARGKDQTRLPVPNLPICRWSSQLFDLGVSSSAGVPVLMLNPPIIYSITVAWENRRNFPTPPLHGFPAKRRLRNKRRNSILMMPHHPDVGSASDCLREISLTTRPIRSTTQIWVATRHQGGISAVVSPTLHVSRINQCSAVVAKYRLFSHWLA